VTAARTILPGFRLAAGFTALYLLLVVLVPMSGLLVHSSSLSCEQIFRAATHPRALAAYRLSFGASLAAGAINAVFGLLLAWVLVRYRFPGRALLDAMVDLPFALPTAVAGLTLTSLFARTGPLGGVLHRAGVEVAYTPLGVVVALTFVGLPFVVRTVQPVLQGLEPELEESAATLGSTRWQTLRWVVLPAVAPSLTTGFALAVARALGEYGSVVFISGNLPMRTEIVPLLIMTRLEQFDYPAATALALVMLLMSFALMLGINVLQRRAGSRAPEGRS
jgi:sulfate transport system permease protein